MKNVLAEYKPYFSCTVAHQFQGRSDKHMPFSYDLLFIRKEESYREKNSGKGALRTNQKLGSCVDDPRC